MNNLFRFRAPLLGLLAVGLLTGGCKKDDDNSTPSGLQFQSHDANRMMTIMHHNMAMMDTMTMTMDPDNDFAMMMKMHHQGAIDMANEEKAKGDNAQMRSFADRVIAAQQAEITQFNAFLAGHAPHRSMMEFDSLAMMAMEKMDRAVDVRPLTGDTDQDFAQLMQDHHQSAVEMSEALIHHGGHDPQMLALAEKIIEDQMKEIRELQEWLKANKGY